MKADKANVIESSTLYHNTADND